MDYPPLPYPPNADLGEGLHHYGIRLLMFVVETDITATMSDIELELAHYVVPFAISNRGKDGTDVLVVERIRVASALIVVTLSTRRLFEAEDAKVQKEVAPVNIYAPQLSQPVNWDEVRKLFYKDRSYRDYQDQIAKQYPNVVKAKEELNSWQKRLREERYRDSYNEGEWPDDKPGDKIKF